MSTTAATNLADSIRIPTLPAAVERIRVMLAQPDVEMKDVVDAFLQDPPLSAKVLRIANSAHYGLQEKTTSVRKAVSVLGLRALSQIVLRAGVVTTFADIKGTAEFSIQDLWKHSILTAQIAECLAKHCLRRASDLASHDFYTCGLLHDLGKIVLFDNLGEHYLEAVRRAKGEPGQQEVEEHRLLGMSHSETGHMAAVMWQIPEPIPSIIRTHHRALNGAGHGELVRVVSCADEIANAVAQAPAANPKAIRARVKSIPGGLSEESLMSVIGIAIASWENIEV